MAVHPSELLGPNESFYPPEGADVAPAFCGTLRTAQVRMHTSPELVRPVLDGRDARIFPGITLALFTLGDLLVPVARGRIVRESPGHATPSYWCVIPELGRVWQERADGGWSRAALPLTLVNDTDNEAHQGLAMFLYRQDAVSSMRFQFVQQTAPYLLKQPFLAWGSAPVELVSLSADTGTHGAQVKAEIAQRLTALPWEALLEQAPPGTLDGFAGPIAPQWIVALALVRDGILYYRCASTPCGDYPYPLEMRFGVRSVMKSIGAPLALLRLAESYGPGILNLKIGDYVEGLDPKYRRIQFIDAADMASGFGGVGTLNTCPNDVEDGHLAGDYDAWYTAPSHDDKIRQMARTLSPYPWEPGTVVRYRDQDFYLLGVAIDAFLKRTRGPTADVWDMLRREVFEPIGIMQTPAIRTREKDGLRGFVWFNAGYYPKLDDLAKIALLYQSRGSWGGRQILHRQLTEDLLAARGALMKSGDASVNRPRPLKPSAGESLYRMGFHFTPYTGSASHKHCYLPTMSGSGGTDVILYPSGIVSIRVAKSPEVPMDTDTGIEPSTVRSVDGLEPF